MDAGIEYDAPPEVLCGAGRPALADQTAIKQRFCVLREEVDDEVRKFLRKSRDERCPLMRNAKSLVNTTSGKASRQPHHKVTAKGDEGARDVMVQER